MKKIIFLMPVYNDWESLNKLLKEIDLIIDQIDNFEFSSVIINDCSTTKVPEIAIGMENPLLLLFLRLLWYKAY